MRTAPFDSEKAKAGHPVCTRDGRTARYLGETKNGSYSLVFGITDRTFDVPHTYTSEGYLLLGEESNSDLFLAMPDLPEGFVEYDPEKPPVCDEGDRIEMSYDKGTIKSESSAQTFLKDWATYNKSVDHVDRAPKRTAYRIIKAKPKPLKLKVGKTYVARDEEWHTIMMCTDDTDDDFPFRSDKGRWFSESGRTCLSGSYP